MAIESIMYMGIGLVSAGLIAVAVMPLVHGRAVRLTTRQLEAALPQSIAEIQADKDLLRAEFAMSTRRLESIVEQVRTKSTSQLVELGKKQDVINRLKIERDTLKIEVTALKMKAEAVARSTKPGEQARLVRVEPAINQAMQEVLRARDESAGQSMQTDTWTRDINGTSLVPTIERSNQGDTWSREKPSERTGEHLRDDSESAQVSTRDAPMSAFGVTADSRARRSA